MLKPSLRGFLAFRMLSSSGQRTNHYDILGVSPKATQSDIKSAYYKLSKLHHPDKTSDEESLSKFRAITEAYEVLGNIKLKKMYDKGLLTNRMHTPFTQAAEPEPADPTLKFYQSRSRRSVAPTMDGRTPIFDFDTWSKHHYGQVFEKQQYEKEFLRKKRAKYTDAVSSTRQEYMIYLLATMSLMIFILAAQGKNEFDIDKTRSGNMSRAESTD